VCTENLIRIDCVTESPKRHRRWSRSSASSCLGMCARRAPGKLL